jgi:hypothetical protein
LPLRYTSDSVGDAGGHDGSEAVIHPLPNIRPGGVPCLCDTPRTLWETPEVTTAAKRWFGHYRTFGLAECLVSAIHLGLCGRRRRSRRQRCVNSFATEFGLAECLVSAIHLGLCGRRRRPRRQRSVNSSATEHSAWRSALPLRYTSDSVGDAGGHDGSEAVVRPLSNARPDTVFLSQTKNPTCFHRSGFGVASRESGLAGRCRRGRAGRRGSSRCW